MIWPFGSKTFLEPEVETWHLETWAWFLRHQGGLESLRETALVLPNRTFFPPTEATGHARAVHLFEQVRSLAGMDAWPCELEAQPERPARQLARYASLEAGAGALPMGTFGPHGNIALVTYDPGLIDDPAAMVAVLAHELSHYLVSSVPEPPPGGDEFEEYATDLCVAFLGFGLFGAATAFRFSQFQGGGDQGWQWERLGYLSHRDWSFGLAVFLSLTGRPESEARPYLSESGFDDLKAAMKYLRRHPQMLDPVRAAHP